MPEVILDYKASVPSNQTGGTAAVPIPISPANIQFADLGIYLQDPPVQVPNRVELKGTLGIQALTGTPVVVIRITRQENGTGPEEEIFNKRITLEPAPAEGFYTASFHTIDFNVAPSSGFVVYRVTGEVLASPAGTAQVVGPISFTGMAVGELD